MASDWVETTLGKFTTLQRGHDLPSATRIAGNIPILGSFGITGWHNESKVSGPGVTVGRSGASYGVVSYSEVDYWPLNTALFVKNFHGNYPKFAYYFLKSMDFERYNSGSAVQSLNRNHIHPIEISIPPFPEQKAIAYILGSLDEKIELNRQMNETLEAMAQALFKSWFVDFDPVIDNALAAGNTIPDEFSERAEQRKGIEKKDNSNIQDLFPNEFEFTEEMGWIPKGWGASTLDDLTTELRRGISPKYTEVDGVRVVNQRCIRNHSIDYSVCRLNDESLRKVEGRHLEVGDVVVNSTGVGTLGRMAQVLYLDEPAVVDSHVTIVRPNTELVKPYTFGRLMLSIEPLVESMGLGSTGQTELSRVHLGELVVCVPPIKLQEFVEKSFLSYSDKSAFNIQQNITLAKLRDTLLPKFMSGELRIADAVALVDEAI